MDAFIGEIRAVPYGYAPYGWFNCDGSLCAISNFQPLYALLGTRFGGDGKATFGLPDLRGRIPFCNPQAPFFTTKIGSPVVTLDATTTPSHTHTAKILAADGHSDFMTASVGVSAAGGKSGQTPGGGFLAATSEGCKSYTAVSATGLTLAGTSITTSTPAGTVVLGPAGSSGTFRRMPPYVAMRYIIAWQGEFPIRP